MDPMRLIPSPDTIPAPWWVFESLELVTFLLHILLVNLVLGGTLFILAGRLLGPRCRLGELGRVLEDRLPALVGLAINMGVAPLLFIQVIYGHLFYASSVLMAVAWILIVPLLIAGYYGTYIHMAKKGTGWGTVAISVSMLVFLYVAFVITSNLTLMERPDTWGAYFDSPQGLLLNLDGSVFWPRWLHSLVASLSVSGLAAAWLWRKAQGPDSKPAAFGLRLYGVTTLVQVAVGLWYFMALPSTVRVDFMGQSALGTGVFTLGMVLGLASLFTAFTHRLGATTWLAGFTLTLMVGLRTLVRHSALDPFANPADLQVVPQTFNLLLFLAIFVGGVGIIAWMIRGALRTSEQEVAS